MNFLTNHYRDSTSPGASFVEMGDFTVLDPLNSPVHASNWNLVQEKSYHITLAVNDATIQAIPGGRGPFWGMTHTSVMYVFFVSPHFWSSFMTSPQNWNIHFHH
jgi:hypothetical protein